MLNLVTGRQGSGKSTIVYNQIKKCLEKGEENLILIVPEQYTLQAERELIEKLNQSGIIDIEVLSFSRLVKRIMNETGGITRTVLSVIGKQMAIKKTFFDNKEYLLTYAGMTEKRGFINEIQELISNLKRKMIKTDDLSELINNNDSSYEMLNRKINDINIIYNSFNNWLGDDYIDNEGCIDLIISNINKSEYIKKSKIWIDGFHTYTEQIFCLLEKLVQLSQDTTITLTIPNSNNNNDDEIFQINNQTKNKLIKIAHNHYKTIKTNFVNSKKSAEINYLEKEIYSYPFDVYGKEVNDIKILQCKNIYSEIDVLCSNIIKLVQDNNYRWKDITVITNDLNSYYFLMKRAFEEYNIPCFIDMKRKIVDKPLSILLINVLKVILYNYRYEDVFALLKTGLTDIEFQEYEVLENYVLKYGIKGKQWKYDFSKVSKEDKFDLEMLNEIRKKIIKPIIGLEGSIKSEGTYKSITNSLYEFIIDLRVEEKIQFQIDELKKQNEYEYASENAQIYNIIIDIFDETVEIFEELQVTIKEYMKVLVSGIESVELAIIPSTMDQVMIGDITRSRSTDIKALFLVGVNEGILPSSQKSTNLFNVSENVVLKEKGLDIFDDIYYKSIQEKYLIYNIISKSQEKIFISYPLADYEGSSLRPSIVIDRFKELFPILKIENNINEIIYVSNSRATIKHMINHYRGLIDEKNELKDSFWDDVYLWCFNNKKWKNELTIIKEAMAFDNRVKLLNKDLVQKIYGDKIKTSVTRFEEYINCPFKHFITYGIGPKKRKIYEISIPDIGEILHKLIYEYSLELEKDKIDWDVIDEEKIIVICDKIIKEFAQQYRDGIFYTNSKYNYLLKYLNRIFIRVISTLTYQYKNGEFKILGNELIFGVGKNVPSIQIELVGKQKLCLEGRIDRVDILEKNNKIYMKILDFKTGDKDFSLNDVYYGLSLQLLVYMWVCLNYGKNKYEKEVIPAGTFYFKLDDPLIKSGDDEKDKLENELKKSLKLRGLLLKDKDIIKSIDINAENSSILQCKLKKDGQFSATTKGLVEREHIEKLLIHIEGIVKNIGEEIFKGNISINPIKTTKQEACTYCPYKGICLFDLQLASNTFNYKPLLKDEEVINLVSKVDVVGKVDK